MASNRRRSRWCTFRMLRRTMARLDKALLCFSKAKKGRFHNYLRPCAQSTLSSVREDGHKPNVDSDCEAAAAGRLSQCRRLDHWYQHKQVSDYANCATWTGLYSIVLSFTGRSLSAEQVCRMMTVLIGCATSEISHELVERSLEREVVFTIPPAPLSMIYWAEGGFTAYGLCT